MLPLNHLDKVQGLYIIHMWIFSHSGLTLHGSNGLVTTSVSLMNISVQPFLVNGHYSSGECVVGGMAGVGD